MIDHEEVIIWFKSLEGHSRIEIMCALLDACLPLELRFLGTYLEYAAGKHYTHLHKLEKDANNDNFINTSKDLSDTSVRRRLCIFLALLHSHNRSIALKLFDVLSICNVINTSSDTNKGVNFTTENTAEMKLSEMKLLLTMAYLHPAFEFNQREILRKKTKDFTASASVTTTNRDEDINLKEKEHVVQAESFSSEVTTTSPVYHIDQLGHPVLSVPLPLSNEMKVTAVKKPLLPSPQVLQNDLRYPIIKSFQYTVPIVPTLSSMPTTQQYLYSRQALPVLTNSLQHVNQLGENTLNHGAYIQHLVTTSSITHPVASPNPIDVSKVIIPTAQNLSMLQPVSSATNLDLISFASVSKDHINQKVSDSAFVEKQSVISNIETVLAHQLGSNDVKKSVIMTQSTVTPTCTPSDGNSGVIVSVYNQPPVVNNNLPLVKHNNSLHDIRTDVTTIPTTSPIMKESPRRCYSESDAYGNSSAKIIDDSVNLQNIVVHRTCNEFQVNHIPRYNNIGPRPRSSVNMLVTYPRLNFTNNYVSCSSLPILPVSSSTSSRSYTDNLNVNICNREGFQTVVTTSMLHASFKSSDVKNSPSMKPKVYYTSGEIIPTGLNGGFIHQPIKEPAHQSITYLNDQMSTQSQSRNIESYNNLRNFTAVNINDSASGYPLPTHTENDLKPLSLAVPNSNSSILPYDNGIDSGPTSPIPPLSPRPSSYHSPLHSPMTTRKSGYPNRDSVLAFTSAGYWLKSLRLHKYSSQFEGFTFQMMKELEEDDLEKRGLTVGARKKFLQAIDQLIKKGFKEFGSVDNCVNEPMASLLLSPLHDKNSPSININSFPKSPVISSPSESSFSPPYQVHLNNPHDNDTVSQVTPIAVSPNKIVNVVTGYAHAQIDKEQQSQYMKKKSLSATCYNCGLAGHYGDECTEQTMEATTYSRYAYHLDFSTNQDLVIKETEKPNDSTVAR